MGDVLAAREAHKRAQEDAQALIEYARRNLGQTLHAARQSGISQKEISDDLDMTRDRLRVIQKDYERSPEPDLDELEAMVVRILAIVLAAGLKRSDLLARLQEPPES